VPLLGLALGTPATLPAQRDHPDVGLTRALGALTRDFRGDVGIYVRHLPTGRTAALRADQRFPTASMIKVPIMATIFERIANGQLGFLDTAPPPRPTARDPGGDLAVSPSATTPPHSGCSSSRGGGAGINQWLESHGFDNTRVNARTAGREAVITRNQEDQSWGADNEGYVLLRRVSALLWRHFEPRHRWAPADGVERFKAH
jgi:beta-lactamase class A